MGFFGGIGGSESKSKSVVSQVDQRVAAQDEAVVVGNRSGLAGSGDVINVNVSGGKKTRAFTTINVERLDPEIFDATIGLLDSAIGDTLGLAAESSERAGAITADALALADKSTARALEAQSAVGELGGLKELLKAGTIVVAIAGAAFVLPKLRLS